MLPILICKASNKSSDNVAKAVLCLDICCSRAEHRRRTRLSAVPQWHPKYCALVHKGHTNRRTLSSSSAEQQHQLSSIIDARIAVAVGVAEPCFLLLLLTPTANAALAWACLWAVSVSVSVLVFAIHSSRTVAVTVVVTVVVASSSTRFSHSVCTRNSKSNWKTHMSQSAKHTQQHTYILCV